MFIERGSYPFMVRHLLRSLPLRLKSVCHLLSLTSTFFNLTNIFGQLLCINYTVLDIKNAKSNKAT